MKKKIIVLLFCLNFYLIGIKCLYCCFIIVLVYYIYYIYNEIIIMISIMFENLLFMIVRICNISNGFSVCRFIVDVFINIV